MEKKYTLSRQLIRNVAAFETIEQYALSDRLLNRCGTFYGWGRKRSGRRAIAMARKCKSKFSLLEDGFIRSVGLGIDGAPAFSIVEDDTGIYYDATSPSRLEKLLQHHDFSADKALMKTASDAIDLITSLQVSKYNHAPDVPASLFAAGEKRILVIAQTAGDASLKYGKADTFTTMQIVNAALDENPGAAVYVKVHPDVLRGSRSSDLNIESIRTRCKIIETDVNPLSLIAYFEKVYTKTSQMGFEALLLGKECVCFGVPFYAGWGVTDDRVRCERRTAKRSVKEIFAAAYLLYSRYYNPYTRRPTDILDTVRTIARYRERMRPVNDNAYFFGFSRWKQGFIAKLHPFFPELSTQTIHFINPLLGRSPLREALHKGLGPHSRIYLWGRKAFNGVEAYARSHNIPVFHIEDGFIRSIGLGSDLTQPYSLVVDRRGIYFDPTQPSDLEQLLTTYDFDAHPELLTRAATLRRHLIKSKISKYNIYAAQALEFPGDKPVILVPGQVEDDASIRYGTKGMNNLELLRRTREERPEAYIVYKPHPDVLVGNRLGKIDAAAAMQFCDRIVTEVSIDSVLAQSDEVYTMTSLVGFEALLRGMKVTVYGLPFYAGWGLSVDKLRGKRRQRHLEIDALVAGVLILYPRYIDPLTKHPCEIEAVLEVFTQQYRRQNASMLMRLLTALRSTLSRHSQRLLRSLAGQ